MSALTDRIAEVLRDHIRIKYVDGTPLCECGAAWYINEGHAAYVAERIEAELQLTELLVKEGEVPPLYSVWGWFRGQAADQ